MYFYDVRILYNDNLIFVTTVSLYNNTFKERVRTGMLQSLSNDNTIDISLDTTAVSGLSIDLVVFELTN